MELKGLTYKSHRLNPGKREHKTPEFMALNPRGKVPVLVDGDVVGSIRNSVYGVQPMRLKRVIY